MGIETLVILYYVVLILMSIALSYHKSHINSLQKELKTLKKELEQIKK